MWWLRPAITPPLPPGPLPHRHDRRRIPRELRRPPQIVPHLIYLAGLSCRARHRPPVRRRHHRHRHVGVHQRRARAVAPPAARGDHRRRPVDIARLRHGLRPLPDLDAGQRPVVRRTRLPRTRPREPLRHRVVRPAAVHEHLPGAEGRTADRLVAVVQGLDHVAEHRPARAVLAGGACLRRIHDLRASPLPQVRSGEGVAHAARERRPARRQRRRRQATRQGHHRRAADIPDDPVFQPVQARARRTAVAAGRIGPQRHLHRPVIGADALEARRIDVDQQRVVAVPRPYAALRPVRQPPRRRRRDRARPRRAVGQRRRLLEDVLLQPPVRAHHRIGMSESFQPVDFLAPRHLRRRRRRAPENQGQERDRHHRHARHPIIPHRPSPL